MPITKKLPHTRKKPSNRSGAGIIKTMKVSKKSSGLSKWLAIPIVLAVAIVGYVVVNSSFASNEPTVTGCPTGTHVVVPTTPTSGFTNTRDQPTEQKKTGARVTAPITPPKSAPKKCERNSSGNAAVGIYDISVLPTHATDLCVSGSTGGDRVMLLAQTTAQSEDKLPAGVANGRSQGFPLCISMKELHRYLNEHAGTDGDYGITHNVYGINTTVVAYPNDSGAASSIPIRGGSVSFGNAYWHCGVVDKTGKARPGYEPCDPKKPVLQGVVTQYETNPQSEESE